MSYIGESQIIRVNSALKSSGETHSNFTATLQITPNNYYTHVSLMRASIPRTFYSVNSPYNVFTLVEGSNTFTVSIREAQYTRKSLIAVVITALNTAGNFTYTGSYDSSSTIGDTGLYTFTVSGNSGVQPAFIFADDSLTYQLGFENGTYNFVANSLTSVDVINLSYVDNVLYIISDMASGAKDSILGSIISSSSSTMSYINYVNTQVDESALRYNGAVNSNTFSFKLVDENFKIVDTRGSNIWFQIILYRRVYFNIIQNPAEKKDVEQV
jgi:hypothetical protein